MSPTLVQRIVFTLADPHKIRSEDPRPQAYDLSDVKSILRVVLGLRLGAIDPSVVHPRRLNIESSKDVASSSGKKKVVRE